jgi:hypothetical protein
VTPHTRTTNDDIYVLHSQQHNSNNNNNNSILPFQFYSAKFNAAAVKAQSRPDKKSLITKSFK